MSEGILQSKLILSFRLVYTNIIIMLASFLGSLLYVKYCRGQMEILKE